MKRLVLVLVVTFGAILAGAARAHSVAPDLAVGAPEYDGNFVERDPASGRYMPLERVTASIETRVRGFGFGGAESHARIPGPTSSVRFKVGQSFEFVVKVASQDQDPLTYVQFYSLANANGDRILPYSISELFRLRSFSPANTFLRQRKVIAKPRFALA